MSLTTVTGTIPTTPPPSSSGIPGNPLDVFAKEFNMYKGEQYHFYCKPEGGGAPPSLYQEILKLAEHKVYIWDSYFRKEDAAIFGCLSHPGISIKIITEQSGGRLEAFKNDCVTTMETAMTAAFRSGCILKVGHPKATVKDWQTHDRFLLVDEKVYLIGSSVNNYTSIQKSTGACEVVSETDKDLIRKAFDYYWTKLDNGVNVAVHSF